MNTFTKMLESNIRDVLEKRRQADGGQLIASKSMFVKAAKEAWVQTCRDCTSVNIAIEPDNLIKLDIVFKGPVADMVRRIEKQS